MWEKKGIQKEGKRGRGSKREQDGERSIVLRVVISPLEQAMRPPVVLCGHQLPHVCTANYIEFSVADSSGLLLTHFIRITKREKKLKEKMSKN